MICPAHSLQSSGLSNNTLKIDLLLVSLVVKLAFPARKRLTLDIVPLIAPITLYPLLDQSIIDLFLHHVDVLEDFLLSLLASHVHHNEVLNIILVPLRFLGQSEAVKNGTNLRTGERYSFVAHPEHLYQLGTVEAGRLLLIAQLVVIKVVERGIPPRCRACNRRFLARHQIVG